MDFGVLQKSSKYFLIYIFFPPFSFRMPPPPSLKKQYTKIRTYFLQFQLDTPPPPPPYVSLTPPPTCHFVPRIRASPLFITIHAPLPQILDPPLVSYWTKIRTYFLQFQLDTPPPPPPPYVSLTLPPLATSCLG